MLGISTLVAARVGLFAVGGGLVTYLWDEHKKMQQIEEEAIEEGILNSWETLFQQLGMIKYEQGDRVRLIKCEKKECYDLYTFKVSGGVKVSNIKKGIDSLRIKLKAPRLEVSGEGNEIYLKNLKSNLPPKKFKIEGNANKPTHLVPVLLNDDNELVNWDMTKDPNLFIGASPGWGKSCILNLIAAYLLSLPKVEQFHIDCKDGAEFELYEGLTGVRRTAKDEETGKKVINGLLFERKYRMETIKKAGCKNYEQYLAKFPDADMTRLVLLIDEVADFSSADNQAINKNVYRKKVPGELNVIEDLRKLTAKGRAAGVHVVMASQRATLDNIDPSTKNNCSGIIGLHVLNEHNSKLIIDEVGLERLTEKGECIGVLGGEKQHMRSLYLDEDYLNKYVEGIRRVEHDNAARQNDTGNTGKARNS